MFPSIAVFALMELRMPLCQSVAIFEAVVWAIKLYFLRQSRTLQSEPTMLTIYTVSTHYHLHFRPMMGWRSTQRFSRLERLHSGMHSRVDASMIINNLKILNSCLSILIRLIHFLLPYNNHTSFTFSCVFYCLKYCFLK